MLVYCLSAMSWSMTIMAKYQIINVKKQLNMYKLFDLQEHIYFSHPQSMHHWNLHIKYMSCKGDTNFSPSLDIKHKHHDKGVENYSGSKTS
jgi:hypothetical protein